MFEAILDQCKKLQENLENLLKETVTLSSKVYKLGFFDFKALDLEKKIRDIKSKVKEYEQNAQSVSNSIDSVAKNLQNIKINSRVQKEVQSINEIIDQIKTMPTIINSYLEDMSTFLTSNNLFGAFMNLIRDVQDGLQKITTTIVNIKNLERVFPLALPVISSFFSRLLPGIGQKLLGGK